MRSSRQLNRRYAAAAGAALAFFAVTGVALIGLMGIAIYTGLQAYFQNEVVKTAHTATMAGAAAYYSGQGARWEPQANTGFATGVANQVFTTIRANSPAMQSFGAAVTNGPSAANNIVTMGVRGVFPTPFLALVGTTEMEVNGLSRAQALRYVPTNEKGVIRLNAQGTNANANGNTMNGYEFRFEPQTEFRFPMIDGTGTEMVVYQTRADNNAVQQGYSVQACNTTTCYTLTTPAGSMLMPGSRRSPTNENVVYGGCRIDLTRALVNKATTIRIVDDGVFDVYYGNRHFLLTNPDIENVIERVEVYGYAAACPTVGACPVPVGFEAITP